MGSASRRGVRVLGEERGLGLVEILLVVVVLAIVGAVLYGYIGSSTRTVATLQEQRPLSQAKITADRATLDAIRSAIQVYYAQQGRWPPDKGAVAALLSPPPSFQCEGNDYSYDPATGQVGLVVDEAGRC